jgi:hypothetical protein
LLVGLFIFFSTVYGCLKDRGEESEDRAGVELAEVPEELAERA